MVYLSSTAIRGAAYDERARILTIQFTSGPQLYDYPGVPPVIWNGLLSASSAGEYFDRHIRRQYSSRKR